MLGVVRANVDSHAGHFSLTPNPFHRTAYVASNNSKVFVEGELAIVDGDSTVCGDPVVGKSARVFVMGKGVHRLGDSTGGHDSWVPNFAASASGKVFAG